MPQLVIQSIVTMQGLVVAKVACTVEGLTKCGSTRERATSEDVEDRPKIGMWSLIQAGLKFRQRLQVVHRSSKCLFLNC